MNQFLSRIFLFLFLGFSLSLHAQNGNNITLQNLGTVKVDDLTDEQIQAFWNQAQERGLSMVQLQQMAVQRNMPSQEFAKLKTRIENLSQSSRKTEEKVDDQDGRRLAEDQEWDDSGDEKSEPGKKIAKPGDRTTTQSTTRTTDKTAKSKVFGADLFNNKKLTFEPNLKIATPQNYQLGPDDELLIDVSGFSEASYKLKVSPDGQIRVPQVGPIAVSGLTIEQARKKITRALSGIYGSVNTGETSINITLGNIRSIKVTVLGEITNPGTYTLPSLATAFNSLYVSGGPNKNGSFRNIKIIRNGKVLTTIDVYEFLLKGEAKGNVRLQDQDVVKVGSYETRVEIKGEVKRTGLYEVTAKETLKDVIEYAGGYTNDAYRDRIKVYRNTSKEKSVADIPGELVPMFVPKAGDVYTVDKVLSRFSNRVQINGAVFRPGFFALDGGLTLASLIKKADGLTEDAFTSRGLIYRLKADNSLEVVSFDLNEVLNGKDIALQREDNIQILSKLKLREDYIVSIAGEVLAPGNYPYAENMRVEDLIVTAGGLRESASKTKIEIARRIKSVDVSNASSEVSTIITYEVSDDLKTAEGKAVVLLPFDVVSIYRLPGFQTQRNITVEGEVLHPGQYTLTRNNEKISEIIKRSGGMTANAFPDGAVLVRTKKITGIDLYIRKKQMESFEKQSKDSSRAKELSETEFADNVSIVGIDLKKILKNPGGASDLIMEEGDVIRIPREVQTVKVSGEVLYPVSIQYKKGKRFGKYINGAGGYTQRALKKKGYVVYTNGSAESTSKFLVFNIHPKIKPGSEVIIPPREERRKLSAVEVVGITSSLATLVLIITTLAK
ncbi:MAG: SLBB domain-containing protein [Bacteroidota bacterium]